jgi:hypothetical protein
VRVAIDEGTIRPARIDTLAHMLVGALSEASTVLGRAACPAQCRRDASPGLQRLLSEPTYRRDVRLAAAIPRRV